MAPSLLDTQPSPSHSLSSPARTTVDTKIFPDGIKTSGQHPPLYDLLRPYSDFPKIITGETVWKAEDYTNNPERWVHVLNDEEVNELGAAADKFIADKTPLTGISKVGQIIIPMDPCLIFYRIISPCQSCPSCSLRSAPKSLTARDLFYSKASQLKSGAFTRAQRPILEWEPT
jgi:hypothetical protein